MKKELKVILTGGGTGGHIYPALAVADGLQAALPGSDFLYIGTRRGLEADLVPGRGLQFKTITAEGLSRKISWPAVRAICKSIKGCLEAQGIIRRFQPDIVIGTGGYVCGPVVLAASLLRVPTLLHEQNAYPGLTNKLLAAFVDKICITFPESAKYFKTKAQIIHTGLPIRPQILQVDREEGVKYFNWKSEALNVIVVGGSQGAQSINQAVTGLYPYFAQRPELNLLHLTGKGGYEEHCRMLQSRGINVANYGNITIKPYLEEMEYALAAADIVIGRAGASFLAEIMAKGVPAILIPYPYAAENHQEHNARTLAKNGAARVILETDLNRAGLLQSLDKLLTDCTVRKKMAEASLRQGRPQALEAIVNNIRELAGV